MPAWPTTSIQADNGAGLTQGIIGLVNKGQPRKLDDWGALRAWAWGASRALDYFESDKSVDARHVGVEGHSRWGKAAIVAMAYDPRFAIVYDSSSGEGGAKLHRRNWGEVVENIADTRRIPLDGRQLSQVRRSAALERFAGGLARAGGSVRPAPCVHRRRALPGTEWADPKGMFLAAVGAGPVYKLLGRKDMGTAEFPPVETALIDGDVAFRQHPGGHTDLPNWPTFLTFADRYMKAPREPNPHR